MMLWLADEEKIHTTGDVYVHGQKVLWLADEEKTHTTMTFLIGILL